MPEDVVAGLGGGKRPKVRVTINGYSYRSSVGLDGRPEPGAGRDGG